MSIIQGTAKGGSTGFYDFPIGDSLRFDGSSYLSRTPTTVGNRRTWTWSGWVKRTSTSTGAEVLFQAGAGSNYIWFLYSANNLYIQQNPSSTIELRTTQVFRDVGAWGHIVLAVDTNQSSGSDRVKLYFNGAQITSFDVSTSNQNLDTYVNNTDTHIIGTNAGFNADYVGYLANIQLIDGQALDASYFGETKGDIWIPKTFDGTSSTGGSTVSTDYGTNGFLLDFSSISGTTINDTAPIDTNHSSANNWTATGF
jgi:hypothetical protein